MLANNKNFTTIRLILGDQLNSQHSWFSHISTETLYILMEIRQETDYVKHHIQKVVGFFAAMRSFSNQLVADGHHVKYFCINDVDNEQSFARNLNKLILEHAVNKFEYQLPDEYRLDVELKTFCKSLKISNEVSESEHFLTSREDLGVFFKGKKQYLMESFYRHMRKKHQLLMDGDAPEGGEWNFDKLNRKKYDNKVQVPNPLCFENDVTEIYEAVKDSFTNNQLPIAYLGTLDASRFIWPISRVQALEALDFFVEKCLPHFGTYEDSLSTKHWSLFHSRLSFAMNSKLISPIEVVKKAIDYWSKNQEQISIQQIEGFVRQIIGWREYMRGIYWLKMPEYESLNFFNHDRKLPNWYWTGETKMSCLKHTIKQSLNYSYAHHIQRLMIVGNFSLLAGLHPDEVDQWYLGIYIDAIQWVEITNTRGMSQYADGGIVGSKPYVSSANYIDKMSDYCSSCYYAKSLKHGERSCPFNSLYWHFYDRNEDKLGKNPRIGMSYVTWNKMDSVKKEKTVEQANYYLKNIEDL